VIGPTGAVRVMVATKPVGGELVNFGVNGR